MMNITWDQCLEAPDIKHADVRQLLTDALVRRCGANTAKAVTASLTPGELVSYLSVTLQNYYGPWVRSWTWSAGDGGLVTGWCCATHSVLLESDEQLNGTVNRIADAVCEWRDTLTEIDQFFERLHQQSSGEPLGVQVERATEAIVTFVIQRNDANDAWYWTFKLILTWFLESLALDPWVIDEQLETIVEGQFSSWMAPSDESIIATGQQLGEVVEGLSDAALPVVDTTQEWLTVRQHFQPSLTYVPKVDVTNDSHTEFIEAFDRPRSDTRADTMKRALRQCRLDAEARKPLDWELLCDWQEIVMGERMDFRTGDAYAKEGRERYPITPSTPKMFRQCLAEANLGDSPTDAEALHAALRVYMDICMFHPFPNGNARSARLAMEHVLYKYDLALVLAEPIFRFPREPQHYHLHVTLQTVTGRRAFSI